MSASRVRRLRVAILIITSLLVMLVVLARRFKPEEEPTITLSPLYTTEPEGAQRALFIGNSHTFTHDIPHMVQRLHAAEGDSPPLWISTVASPGAILSDLRARSTQAHTAQAWTFTVIQPGSVEMFYVASHTEEHGRALIQEAHTHNSQAIWFDIWPRAEWSEFYSGTSAERASPQTMREHMRDTTERILLDTPARNAPVAQSWHLAQTRHPTLQLYARDGNHTSPEGAYLTALTLHAAMRGKPATPGPAMWRPELIPSDTAIALQKIAAEVYSSLAKN